MTVTGRMTAAGTIARAIAAGRTMKGSAVATAVRTGRTAKNAIGTAAVIGTGVMSAFASQQPPRLSLMQYYGMGTCCLRPITT